MERKEQKLELLSPAGDPERLDSALRFGAGAVYLAAVGGAAALIKSCVRSCECVAYPDLGCEAIYRLQVENFETVVAIDAQGNSILK